MRALESGIDHIPSIREIERLIRESVAITGAEQMQNIDQTSSSGLFGRYGLSMNETQSSPSATLDADVTASQLKQKRASDA